MSRRAMNPSGLADKLYWRAVGGVWHCFKKLSVVQGSQGGFVSLCEKSWLSRSYGQAITRPRAELRCGRCDGLEMERRGWSKSGPER